MHTITAKEWTANITAHIWEETGKGSLRPVTGITRDYWIRTGGTCSASWCCTPDTRLYVGTPEEIKALETELRGKLESNRLTWTKVKS
ncbi:MAG: hypothetical protein KGJ13_10570 [Patescibacteria group bacterium]|nr:hypothetical protein [Patescibacteria group bacterium]